MIESQLVLTYVLVSSLFFNLFVWPKVVCSKSPKICWEVYLSEVFLPKLFRPKEIKTIFHYVCVTEICQENFQEESLGGRVDLGTSSQVISFRARGTV